jgi:hypothetical protein
MLKKMLMRLAMLLIVLCGPAVISSTAQTRPEGSAPDSRTIQVANERLAKTLDALEKADDLNKSLQNLIDKQTQLLALNDEIIKKKDLVISDQAKLIAILEKQNKRQLRFLWGVISIRF